MTCIVGQNITRVDAKAKFEGKAKYIDDIDFPGQIYGVTLRSIHPCANIKEIKFNPDFDWSDVVTVQTKDIPGENVFNNFNMDVPFLPKNNRVNYVGEAIMLIAAPTLFKAREALQNVTVEYEVLEPSLNVDEGLAKKSLIYEDHNIIKQYTVKKGDIQKGFEQATTIFEGTYETPYQEQAYIEPQGMVAVPEENGVTIYGSMQCPYYVRKESELLFTFPPENLRVVQVTTGGAFGGKEHYPSIIASHAALLAVKSRKPVKMIYDRHEDIEATTKRHPSIVHVKTGVDDTGKLVAMEVYIIFDSGAYSMASPVVLARGTIAGAGAYNCENISILARAVATNLIPTSAFRGFGAPQVFFAIERHMTRLAEKLKIHPLSFKKKNLLRQYDVTATGQTLKDPVGLWNCFDAIAKKIDFENLYLEYAKQPRNLKKRRGIGLMAVFHGAGFTGKGEEYIKAIAGIKVLHDGTVKILCSTTEMGQGMRTILPQIVAECLEIAFERVSVEVTDTALVPNSGPTVASRTTMIIGKVLSDASHSAIKTLCELIATEEGVSPKAVTYSKGIFKLHNREWGGLGDAVMLSEASDGTDSFYAQYVCPPGTEWDEVNFHGTAYAGYAWGVTVADVEVDLESFEIEIKRLVTAIDMGKAVNPILVEGQIEGGVIQGMGYSLLEDLILKNGKIMNNSFTNYIVPTSCDIPFVEPIIVEVPYPNGPYGAKGLGEITLVVVSAAIADAVSQATGLDITKIPISPEKLYELSVKKESLKDGD